MTPLILTSVAMAATPTPDRPYVTRTGQLVAKNTLEMELGSAFAAGPTRSVPSALKFSIAGLVEPRIMADLGGVLGGTPGLGAGAKIRLFDSEGSALAMWVASAVPIADGEIWSGQFHALFTTDLTDTLNLRIQGGLDFIAESAGGPFGGTPVTGALTLFPMDYVSVFVEVAGRAGGPGCDGAACAYGDLIFQGGGGLRLTDTFTLDGAIGYSVLNESVLGTVGFTGNFGQVNVGGS
ncbi:MAG: hypothetical protein KTR31_21370 [Myxococcales bacterium]|nr:hypothetical protein [Myxococcales bacterium]